MTVKKIYEIGDTVWIYGISIKPVKSTQGKIIHKFTLEHAGYNEDIIHYVVEVPSEIENLIEVRTWATISQTKDGYVGGIRASIGDADVTRKSLYRVGLSVIGQDEQSDTTAEITSADVLEEDEPSPDVIHAALEKSRTDNMHQPLILKENTPKRRFYKKKKS
jgi:hypothetical protein